MDVKEASQLGIVAIKKKAKARVDEIEAKAKLINPNIRIVKETYVNTRSLCQWEDVGFGFFWRHPLSVLQQNAAFHPDHTQLRKQEAGTYERLAAKSKQAIRDKYGVDNPSQIPGVQEKVQKTKRINGTDRQSAAEREFGAWLTSLKVAHKKLQVPHKDTHFLIDFYLSAANIAIEYNGDFWHSNGNKHIHRDYHLQRTQACAAKGIQLIHIFASEWTNNRERIASFLLSKLQKPKYSLHARKLNLVKDPTDWQDFFKQHHMQGAVPGTCYALVDITGVIQSAIIIGRHHRTGKQNVLRRFASRSQTRVRGALSRLSKAAVVDFGPLISWVDLRWSGPQTYTAAGWTVEETLPPDYWYWDDRSKKAVSKQSRKKSTAQTPANLTEYQHAAAQKLWKIYDCGKLRLTFG